MKRKYSLYNKAAPFLTLTLYAKVLKFFKNVYYLDSMALVFEQSLLRHCDKKSNFSVKRERAKELQPPYI